MAVIEQRVVNERPKIGPRGGGGGGAARPEPEAEAAAGAPAKSKKKLVVILGVVVAIVAAAAYYFLVMSKADAAAEPAAPEPGAVHKVEAMSINLADGRYLRIAVGLQLTLDGAAGHGGEFDDSKARNAIIDLFSGLPVAEVAPGEAREALRKELATTLEESYHGGVMDVYLIDFVTQ